MVDISFGSSGCACAVVTTSVLASGAVIPVMARTLRAGQHAPREGTNDAGGIGYTGPCPPSGVHRYVFRLYALKAPLRLARGASRKQFLAALRGKTLAVARLVGRYGR